MARRLYLHVGDCKTGSTSIQSMLATGGCDTRPVRLFAPNPFIQGGLPPTLNRLQHLQRKRWGRIARSLSETPWDVGVISSELFEFVPPASLVRALREHLPEHADTARVIAYIRPHAGRLVSQFAENLNLGHDTGSLQDCFARMHAAGRLDYASRLERWKACFGDRLIVRPFLRNHLAGGDVRHDFLSVVLGGGGFRVHRSGEENMSLGLADLSLMRMLNRRFAAALGGHHPNQVAFGKHFARILRSNPSRLPAQRLRIPRAVYDRLCADYRADAEKMDETWFGGPCFVPALEAAGRETVQTPQPLDPGHYHSPETLRLMECWADLMIRQIGDDPEAFSGRMRPGR